MQTPSLRAVAAAALVTLPLLAVVVIAPDAQAADATVLPTPMPARQGSMASVWTGTHVYTFGGRDVVGTTEILSDRILRFDPVTGATTVMGARLPVPMAWLSAAWSGQYAYVFSDCASLPPCPQNILRYDPATDTLTDVGASLPGCRFRTAAAWAGSYAYVFGGTGCGSETDEILRYDPVADTFTVVAHMPAARFGQAAVFDGDYIYLFGGNGSPSCGGCGTRDIVRFDPRTAVVTLLAGKLPVALSEMAAGWDGCRAYVFGGWGPGAGRSILAFNPVTGTVATAPDRLAVSLIESTAAWTGSSFHLLGGWDSEHGGFQDKVERYTPPVCKAKPTGAHLLPGRFSTSAVWTGTHAFVFGGETPSGTTNQILRYDPATDTVTVMGATLPTARRATSAVWDGTHAYVFGGYPASATQIVRYDPATDTAVALPDTFPSRRWSTSAVWDGEHAYVFGGSDGILHPWGTPLLPDVLRFDPATGATALLPATLATPRDETSAFFDGQDAYVIGGRDMGGSATDITRFTPATGAASPSAMTLPYPTNYNSVAWDGENAYVFGGMATGAAAFGGVPGAGYTRAIVQLDPVLLTVRVIETGLPTGRLGTSAVWDGEHAHVFGGKDNWNRLLDEVVQVQPPLESPRFLTVCPTTPGTSGARNLLTWDPPVSDGGSPILYYRIYRGTTSGSLAAHASSATTSYTDPSVAPGTTYYYQVTAFNGVEGYRSNEAVAPWPPPASCAPPLPCPVPLPGLC